MPPITCASDVPTREQIDGCLTAGLLIVAVPVGGGAQPVLRIRCVAGHNRGGRVPLAAAREVRVTTAGRSVATLPIGPGGLALEDARWTSEAAARHREAVRCVVDVLHGALPPETLRLPHVCLACGQALTDAESKRCGVGPTCRKRVGRNTGQPLVWPTPKPVITSAPRTEDVRHSVTVRPAGDLVVTLARYDSDLVGLLRTVPHARYRPETRTWLVGARSAEAVLGLARVAGWDVVTAPRA